jgi:hypothetical protein
MLKTFTNFFSNPKLKGEIYSIDLKRESNYMEKKIVYSFHRKNG